MPSFTNKHLPPVALTFVVVSVSVSSQASAQAAGIGPFRGLYIITSTTFSINGQNGQILPMDNIAKNTFIWIEGSFIGAIVTATSIYALN